MKKLTTVEQECQMVLVVLNEMMTPGHPMTSVGHTELHGKVRDALRKLENKEYGCVLGIHAMTCRCKEAV